MQLNKAAGRCPNAVAIVLWPAAMSALASTIAPNAWMPDVQRLKTRPFWSTLSRVSWEKLNPQNQVRNTIKPFDIESMTGISFNRRGGTEYCQLRKSRHVIARVLWSRRVKSETPSIKIVDKRAEIQTRERYFGWRTPPSSLLRIFRGLRLSVE